MTASDLRLLRLIGTNVIEAARDWLNVTHFDKQLGERFLSTTVGDKLVLMVETGSMKPYDVLQHLMDCAVPYGMGIVSVRSQPAEHDMATNTLMPAYVSMVLMTTPDTWAVA